MMKRIGFALLAGLMLCCACQKKNAPVAASATVALEADASFNAEGVATLTLTMSEALSTNTLVTLGVGFEAENGKTLVAVEDLTFKTNPVTILMSKTRVTTTVTLAPSARKENAQAVIVLESVQGAKVKEGASTVYINWTGGNVKDLSEDPSPNPDESLDPEDSSDPGVSEDPVVAPFEPTKGWKIEYLGVQTDDEGSASVFEASGHKGEGIYIFLAEAGYLSSYDSLEDFLADATVNFQDDVQYYADYGWTAEDLIYTDDPVNEYYDVLDAGDYEIFMVGMDATGKTSGHWAWCAFTADGEGSTPEHDITLEGPVTRNSAWKASYVGRYSYDEEDEETGETTTYQYDRFEITGTGNNTFTFALFEPGDVEQYDMEELLLGMAADVWSAYDEMAPFYEALGWDIAFTGFMYDNEFNYDDYEAVELGTYDVLIVGISAAGNPTGQYNVCQVQVDGTVFTPDDGYEASARMAPKLRKACHQRPSVAVRPSRAQRLQRHAHAFSTR